MSSDRKIFNLLDLFCCEGGAGVGYGNAGFSVTGIDKDKQPKYPLQFIQCDAFEYLEKHGHKYDAIHASPPCQMYSKAFKHMAHEKPMVIDVVRKLLQQIGKPWIIENVIGSPLIGYSDLFGANGVELCGTMFGLTVYRHRIFETSFALPNPPPCDHSKHALNPHSSEGRKRIYEVYGRGDPEKLWADAMGVPWMTRHGARQCVPPAYTEWIGKHLHAILTESKP